jgi:hypothetical protein
MMGLLIGVTKIDGNYAYVACWLHGLPITATPPFSCIQPHRSGGRMVGFYIDS